MGRNAADGEPEHRCVCSRLAEPFVEDGLPDHVCLETMVASIRSAIRDKLVPPADWWPVPTGLKKQALGLVIREWVEGAPSETLANQLEADRHVRYLVNSVEVPDLPPDADPRDVAIATYRAALVRTEPGGELDRRIAAELRRRGLPANPAILRHVRARAAGRREPLPAHGLLVTTRAYVYLVKPPDRDVSVGNFRPPHDFAVSGLAGLAPAELWDAARKAVNRHQQWLRRWRCPDLGRLLGTNYLPLLDPHARSRAHPAATAAAKTDDYLDEARAGAPDLIAHLRRARPDRHDEVIARYLREVQDRVARCRRKRGLPTTPPVGWRAAFRREVAEAMGDADRTSSRRTDP